MIRKAVIKDLDILAELACQLWPNHTVEEMRAEYADMIAKPDAAFFLAFCPGNRRWFRPMPVAARLC